MIILDPNAKRIGQESNIAVSALSLFVNIPAVFFWKLNKVVSNMELDLKSNIYIQTVLQFILYNTLSFALNDAKLDFSDKGLIGFMRSDNALFCFGPWSVIAGFWGCAGYVWALQYWSPLIVMNCLLIEPLLG